MNLAHRWLCRSAKWKFAVEQYIVPWVLEDMTLGNDVLEIGPGPGLTTDVLRAKAPRLTCVEIDSRSARKLARRLAGTNVTVLNEDATSLSLSDASFDTAICLTMLHHVPSASLQNTLFAEARRVLKPGGVFMGVDSLPSRSMKWLHLFDTMVLVDPATLRPRLEAVGFRDVQVDVNPYAFRFRGVK